MFDSTVIEALKWGGIVLGTLGGGTMAKLLYDGTHGRIKRVEDAVSKKADITDVEHVRGDIQTLWAEVNKVRTDMNGGFESIRKDMHAAHIDLVQRLPRKQ